MTADEFTINLQKSLTYAVLLTDLQILDYIMSKKSKKATQEASNEIKTIRQINFEARRLIHCRKVSKL